MGGFPVPMPMLRSCLCPRVENRERRSGRFCCYNRRSIKKRIRGGELLTSRPPLGEMFQHQQLCGGVLIVLVALATLAGSSPSHPFGSAVSSAERNQRTWLERRANVPIPDPASRVNLFIGTTSTGHAFPGERQSRCMRDFLTYCWA